MWLTGSRLTSSGFESIHLILMETGSLHLFKFEMETSKTNVHLDSLRVRMEFNKMTVIIYFLQQRCCECWRTLPAVG